MIVSGSNPLTSGARDIPDHKLQHAWQLFVSLEYQVQVADRKVQAVFGVNGLLVAALSFQSQSTLSQLRSTGISAFDIVGLSLRVLLLGLVCIATLSAVIALRPRLSVKSPAASPVRSLFFFGDIVGLSAQEFVSAFLDLSDEQTAEQMLHQAHTVAGILHQKYRWLNRATSALMGSLVLWVCLQIVRLISM